MDIFDKSTGLYFYSAVFQGNMALLAFVGVFAVYRLQLLANAAALKERALFDYVQNAFQATCKTWFPIKASAGDEIEQALKSVLNDMPDVDILGKYNPTVIKETAKMLIGDHWLTDNIKTWKSIRARSRSVLTSMVLPIGLIASVIVSSVILLPLSVQVNARKDCLEPVLFVITIMLNVIAIGAAFRYVYNCLTPEDEK